MKKKCLIIDDKKDVKWDELFSQSNKIGYKTEIFSSEKEQNFPITLIKEYDAIVFDFSLSDNPENLTAVAYARQIRDLDDIDIPIFLFSTTKSKAVDEKVLDIFDMGFFKLSGKPISSDIILDYIDAYDLLIESRKKYMDNDSCSDSTSSLNKEINSNSAVLLKSVFGESLASTLHHKFVSRFIELLETSESYRIFDIVRFIRTYLIHRTGDLISKEVICARLGFKYDDSMFTQISSVLEKNRYDGILSKIEDRWEAAGFLSTINLLDENFKLSIRTKQKEKLHFLKHQFNLEIPTERHYNDDYSVIDNDDSDDSDDCLWTICQETSDPLDPAYAFSINTVDLIGNNEMEYVSYLGILANQVKWLKKLSPNDRKIVVQLLMEDE